MKNIINFIFALFLSISALDVVAQENAITMSIPEYTFDKPDFNYPQTVIANASTELNTALKLHDGERIVLALIQASLAKSMISNDSLPNIIDKIESIASIEPNKCISSVLYLLEANIINEYYSRNRYKLSNRTEISSNSSNIFEWNEAQFKTHISSLLDKAISENNALKSAKITNFSQIVKINKVSVSTYPTMFDFVAQQCINIYQSWSSYNMWNPFAKTSITNQDFSYKITNIYNELLSFHKDGSRPYINAILNKTTFENPKNYYNNPKLNAQIDSLYNIYKNKANVAPIILKLQRNNKELYSIYTDYIANFPKSNYTPLIQSRLIELEKPSATLVFDKQFNSTDSITMVCHVENTNNLGISIYKVNKSSVQSKDFITQTPVITKEFHSNGVVPFTDTIQINLPALDYGMYVPIVYSVSDKGKKVESNRGYDYYNTFIISDLASFSVRNNSNKTYSIFALNAKTGAPTPHVTISASGSRNNSETFNQATNKDGKVVLDNPNYYNFKFAFGSDKHYTANYHTYFYTPNFDEYQYHCDIFTDLAIYRPGETIKLATVCYRSNAFKKTILKNFETSITLFDSNNDTISSITAFTDEMGRIAHDFSIPIDRLNGAFSIRISSPKNPKLSAYKSINVSEYKTPSFYIDFIDEKSTYPENGNITIHGVAKTFSGVPLSNTSVKCALQSANWGNFSNIANTTISTDEMGNFDITFDAKAVKEQQSTPFTRYRIQAIATDKAGETQSSNSSAFVIGSDIQITWKHDEITNIDASHICTLPIEVNSFGENAPQSYSCTLVLSDKDGNTSRLHFSSSKPDFDFSKIASGEYTAQAWLNDDSATSSDKAKIIIYRPSDKVPPIESALWIPITQTDCVSSRKGSFLIGNSFDKSYIYYTISHLNSIIDEGWITLKRGISPFKFTMPKCANSSAILRIEFNCFKNGKKYSHTVTVTPKIEQPKTTLTVSSFRDKITAGEREKWTLHLATDGKPVANGAIFSVLTDKALNSLADNTWNFAPTMTTLFSSSCLYTQSVYSNSEYFSWKYKNKPTYLPKFSEPILYLYDQHFFASNAKNIRIRGTRSERSFIATEQQVYSTSVNNSAVVRESKAADELTTDGALNLTEESSPIMVRTADIKTAFWQPLLVTDDKGNASIEFDVPNMNTTWLFQAIGYSKGLNTASILKETVANKPIMVNPNMPRFLRQGDKATLMASVQNITDSIQNCSTEIELFNPFTNHIYARQQQNISVPKNGTEVVAIEYAITDNISALAFRIKATNGSFSDGEQVIIPVLQATSPIIEATPFYITPESSDYTINLPTFPEKAKIIFEYCDNPIWYVATALPSLKSNDNTTTTSIVHSLFANLVAKKVAQDNPNILEALDYWAKNPQDSALVSMLAKNNNLKIGTLLASPWLKDSEEQTLRMSQLKDLFDNAESTSATNSLIDKLAELQLSDGGFAWFSYPNAKSSAYTTLYVLQVIGRIKALNAIDNDSKLNDIITKAVKYLDIEIINRYNAQRNKLDFSNYLDYAYTRYLFIDIEMSATVHNLYTKITQSLAKEWKEMNIVDKAFTTITLAHFGKQAQAKPILESLNQFSVYRPSTGRFWDNLQNSWYRSDNKVTLTSLILQAYHIINPKAIQINQIRQWLLLAKQSTDWGNSSLAADAVYALLSTGTNWLTSAQSPTFSLNGKPLEMSNMDRILGYGKIELNINNASHNSITIQRNSGAPSWGAVYCQYNAPMKDIQSSSIEELSISKEIRPYSNNSDFNIGDKVQVRLTITNTRDIEYVTLSDERPACIEPLNQISGYHFEDGIGYYLETKDSKSNIFFNHLPKGTHVITYDAYVTNSGYFNSGVATIQCQYAPQITAHSAGTTISVK